MLLDVRTLYVAMAAVAMSLGTIQLLACVTRRFASWVGWWGASNLLIGIGMMLLCLRGIVPDALSHLMGAVVVVCGYCMLHIALRRFDERPLNLPLHAFVCALVAVLVGGVWREIGDFTFRATLASVVPAAYGFWMGWDARRIALREGLFSARVLSILFFFTATLLAARGMVIAAGMLGDPDVSLLRSENPWLALVGVVLLSLRNMAMMLTVTERYHKDWARRALHDPLTGALNRAGMRAAFDAVRGQGRGAMSVMLIDLDRFKEVNDAFGHAEGDRVLLRFLAIARATLRRSDIVGRHGGDEFVALLPETAAAEAKFLAERLRRAFREEVGATSTSLSIGVSTAAQATSSLEAMLAQADAALYRAKHGGRNQVCAEESSRVGEAAVSLEPVR